MANGGRISRRGAGRVAVNIAGGVLSCLAVAIAIVATIFWNADDDAFARAMACAIMLPIILGTPWFLVLSLKLRELARLNVSLRSAASHDAMTGLLNWSAFHRVVLEADGTSGALLLIDIDHFKAVNDHWGHQTGDAMLRHVADMLARVVGARGTVGRLGGEEFGVFLPATDAATATVIAEALRGAVAASRSADDGTADIALTVSIGGVAYAGVTTNDEAMRAADGLLYRAKANGRDRVEVESLPCGAVAGPPV